MIRGMIYRFLDWLLQGVGEADIDDTQCTDVANG